jgi:hypothetical protein
MRRDGREDKGVELFLGMLTFGMILQVLENWDAGVT